MYRKKGRGWTKHIDFMLLDIICILIAFFISYVIRFGFNNPYVDKDYRTLGVAFLLIDFFVEIMADSFKNVLKRGYLDEFISTCKHAVLVFLVTALFLFTTQMADIYSRLSFYIMFPIYVTIAYIGRIALKNFLKKKDFATSKRSLFVIAPDAILRDTLRTVEKSCIGYTRIVAASLDTDMKGKTYKFRSMYMDAEERKKELAAQNKVGDGMMFKMDFDPRIIGNKVLPNGKKKTGIGQFIRKTSLDEFPQFFNILVRDMSLVGTRSPTLDELEKYEPHHRARMSFRRGISLESELL